MIYDFRKRSDACLVYNNEPSRTKQDAKASCDINNILKRYTKNGVNPYVVTQDARYGDYATLPVSYQDALNLIISADEQFLALPARLRQRFRNDPAELLRFLGDDSNRAEAIELGLLAKPNSTPETPVAGVSGASGASSVPPTSSST